MASAEGKAPLTVQLAMASWVAPLLASFANTLTKNAGEREPIVVIGAGVALVGAVLLGLLCGVAGLVAASRDPLHRVTLRRHSVAGLIAAELRRVCSSHNAKRSRRRTFRLPRKWTASSRCSSRRMTMGDRRRGARIRSRKGGSGVRGAVLATGRFLFRERSSTDGMTQFQAYANFSLKARRGTWRPRALSASRKRSRVGVRPVSRSAIMFTR